MTQQSQPSARIVLSEDDSLGKIRVDLDVFLDFDLRLDRDLEILVSNWAHAAAPNASRSGIKRKVSPKF